MTLEQVLKVVDKYEAEIKKDGRFAECFRGGFPKDGAYPVKETALRHVLWMFGEMRAQIAAQETEKVMRWLGFVQGTLWAFDGRSIDEMRDDNRGGDAS